MTVKKVLSYTLPKMRRRHDTNLLMECLFVDGWMEWTGVCRWELIQENDQTRTGEIQNTIKSSQGRCDHLQCFKNKRIKYKRIIMENKSIALGLIIMN